MKKLLPVLFFSFIFSFWFAEKTQAQCSPDMNCVEDTVGNGKMCPDSLSDGYIGISYNEVITVIPPDHATISGNDVTIDHLTLNSVGNMPPGLQYTPDDADMYPPNYYCILIDGTPTDTGFYQLEIHVQAYVDIQYVGIIDAGEFVDDSSLSITIRNTNVAVVENNQNFIILGAQPNPFYGQTYIKYYSPYKEEVSLIVYDLLGNKIYDETMISRKGINKFNFTGIKLAKGIYCYSITAHNKTYTKRMIKTN